MPVPGKFPKTALLIPVAGLLAGLLLSFALTPQYISTATLALVYTGLEREPAAIHFNLVEFFIACQGDVLSRTSLANVILQPSLSLYPEARGAMPLEDVIEMMRHEMKVQIVDRPGYPRQTTTVFQISFPYREAAKAQATVQYLITRFIDTAQSKMRKEVLLSPGAVQLTKRIEQLEARTAALEGKRTAPSDAPAETKPDTPPMSFSILDPPNLPESPVYPNRALFMASGFGVGLLGLIAVRLLRRR